MAAHLGGWHHAVQCRTEEERAMTWIEVVDTAVKISMGALVAGGFGYLNARLSYQRDDQARYATRRRDHLDKILDLLTEVEHTYISQKGALERYRFYKNTDVSKANLASQEFSQLDDKLYAETAKFTRASSVLLMFGQKSTEAKLMEYRDAVDEWYQNSILDLDGFSEEALNRLRRGIIASHAAAFAALYESYKST
jgi:hypothetical protein